MATPCRLLKKTINKVLQKLYIPFGTETSVKQDVPKEVVYFSSYFLGTLNQSLSQKMNELLP